MLMWLLLFPLYEIGCWYGSWHFRLGTALVVCSTGRLRLVIDEALTLNKFGLQLDILIIICECALF